MDNRDFLKRELALAHDDGMPGTAVNLAAVITELDRHRTFQAALDRSPYDICPCQGCGEPVVCVPDGMPMCEGCEDENCQGGGSK